jgi:N-carbamoylputrescine amidase
MQKTIKAASVQFTHKAGDKAANFAIMESWIQKASEKGVELLVFPEMCITGYWHVRNLNRDKIAKLAEPFPVGESCRKLLEYAKNFNMAIGAGFIEAGCDGELYNAYVVAKPDGELVCHRKLHCFISEHMASGNEFTVFELKPGLKAGILICYDNNIIENVRANALAGAEILIAPHQTGGCHTPSPLCMGKIDVRLWENRLEDPDAIEAEFKGSKGRGWLMKWLPARAHDNGMFLIFSNGVGQDDDEVRTGNSMILDPYGNILAETWKAGDDMVIADLDLTLLPKCIGRRWIKSRRPELYQSLIVKTGQEEDTRSVRFAE